MRFVRFPLSFLLAALLLLTGCEKSATIVNDLNEREANEIVVFLSSKGIPAMKVQSAAAAGPGGESAVMWSIAVDEKQEVEAMAILNRNGLPRMKEVSLLTLFAKSGLISSEREENIRFQAGLAAQIAGTIRKIDGVIDAVVELSIPQQTTIAIGGETGEQQRPTAAVFVKHQGILDDPNSHLVTKIKRLVAGSIAGLEISDVTVISDRSRFTDITIGDMPQDISPEAKEYVSIWSIVMSKSSAARFRFLFFLLIIGMIAFAVAVGWMFWKFYPIVRKRGLKNMLSPIPFRPEQEPEEDTKE